MRGVRSFVVATALVCGACAAIAGLEDKEPYPADAAAPIDSPVQEEASGDDGPGDDGGADVVATGEIVARDLQAPVGVAVDSTYLYYTDEKGGNVWRIDKTLDGGAQALATMQDAPRHVVLDAQYVYWYNANRPAHMAGGNPVSVPIFARVNRATPGAPEILYSASGSQSYLDLAMYAGPGPADDTMFAVSPSSVHRFSRSDASASGTQCAPGAMLNSPSAVAADIDFVWWVNQGTQQTWRRLKTFTTTNNPPNAQPYGPVLGAGVVDMTLDDGYLYYATIGGDALAVAHGPSYDGGLVDAAVLDAAIDAGSVTKLGTIGATPAAIVVSSGALFATRFTKGADGEVVMIPKGGGTPVVLATGQRDPRDLAVDGDTVYWASYGDGTIRRVKVP